VDVVVYDEEDRRYVPLVFVLLLALLLAVLAVLATGLALRGGSEAAASGAAIPRQQTSSDQAGTVVQPSGDCLAALERGDTTVARAERLESELKAHTEAMDDLLAKRITADQLVDRSLPVLTESATDRRRFAEELKAYQAARRACGQGTG
jgi:hypothetical protein